MGSTREAKPGPNGSVADAILRLNAALQGRYRIERELGKGSMATVYLADDLKLQRRVALKVLKPELSAVLGAERFLDEIRTTASLQHPHILPLFDSGEADGFLFYVMPFVDGESLRARLDREHQLPMDDAVDIAASVAEGLDHAHRHGVIHRDIKPANILLADGKPLIADFGIALAVSFEGDTRLTETGLSLGTPDYMSPEQATGEHNVGPATDIWALGCVLYEMLVGQPPFIGSTPQAVLGKIITGEVPSAKAERPSVPPHVDAVIAKALEKVPADRFGTLCDFVSAISDPSFRQHPARGDVGKARRPWQAATGFLLGAAATGVLLLGWGPDHAANDRPSTHVPAPFLPGEAPTTLGRSSFDLSADGELLVYRHGPLGDQLRVRDWSTLESIPLRESIGGIDPAFSPDSRFVAFSSYGEVKVAPVGPGQVRSIMRGMRPEWGPDGRIYASTDAGLVRRSSDGTGPIEEVSRLEVGEISHTLHDVLPGNRHALIEVRTGPRTVTTELLDLRTGERERLFEGAHAIFLPDGYLLFHNDPFTLMAAPFDVRSRQTTGDAMTVLEGVRAWSISRDGDLYYSTVASTDLETVDFGTRDRVVQLSWVTRDGSATPVDEEWTIELGNDNASFELSPDGRSIAFRERGDIWVRDLATNAMSRLTRSQLAWRPTWGPAPGDVTFASRVAGNSDAWMRPASGARDAALIVDFARSIAWLDWSQDGRWLVFMTSGPIGVGGRDVYAVRAGPEATPRPLFDAPDYDERTPVISPDGRFIAVQTNETGRIEVWVHPFPDVNADRFRISIDGGSSPRWSRDGRELFFQSLDNEMMVVDVDTRSSFEHGTPRRLFERDPQWVWISTMGTLYDVHPDGDRFLVARLVSRAEGGTEMYSALFLNFGREVKRLLAN